MGIGWDKDAGAGVARTGRPEVDLDATALQFAGRQAVRPGLLQQPADPRRVGGAPRRQPTGSGEGDDEAIRVDLARVHGPVDTILFLVSSYQGHSLEWVANAYCRLVDDETDEELARFTLTFSVKETGRCWRPAAAYARGLDARAVGEGVAITVPTAEAGEADPLRQLSEQDDQSRPRRPAWPRPRSRSM